MKTIRIVVFLLCFALSASESLHINSNGTLCDICECVVPNSTTIGAVSVDCTRRTILEISEGMEVPEDIDVLNLTENRLKYPSITPSGRRVKVRSIIFRGNKIERLAEPDFYHVDELQELDLSFNKIVQITGRPFIYVKSLRTLDLSGNVLRELPEGIFKYLTKLQKLKLSRNPLHILDKNLVSEMPSLTDLDLSSAALEDIHPDAFKGCNHLQFLDLSWNNFQVIPTKAFETVDHLQYLKLTGNPIRVIEGKSFWFPTGLLEVHLDQMPNLFEVRANAFRRQPSLLKVNLSGNSRLSLMDASAFKGIHSLRTIDLSGNQLSRIENGDEMPALCEKSEIDLSGNHWNCDCHLKWVVTCSSTLNYSSITCAGPSSLKGLQFSVLKENDLTCEDELFLTGIGHLDKRMGLALFCLGVLGVLVSICGIYVLVKHKPRITWNRRVKDKNEDLYYVRMKDRDPEKITPRRY